MSTQFFIKDHNGIYSSTDGKTKYSLLEGRAIYDFLNTEDGKRRSFYVDIDENGDKIGIETEPCKITSCSEQYERDRYRYKLKNKLNITIVSANTTVSFDDEDDIELIETIADEDVDVETTAMHALELETMRSALKKLTKDEYTIIYYLYLAKEPLSERQLSAKIGIPQRTVNYRKSVILKKLKNFF